MALKKKINMFGIDVSQWQGVIDWKAVKEDPKNVEFAIIKATEGVGFRDKQLVYNAVEAKRNNIKISYYHFATLNSKNVEADAKAEAEYFLATIKDLPKADLPLVLDIETDKIGLSNTEVLLYINTFFKALGTNDYMLYSYTPFLNINLPKNHGLGNIPLWIAAYTRSLKLPNGWTKCWAWQYTQKGKINGIKGNVDLNK
jgi:lysozyme